MRVHERVAVALRRRITERYQPGDHLPPIRELARRFKVSPTTICQTLAVLANEGLVEQRHGSGVYVREQIDARAVAVVLELDFAAPDVSYFWRQVSQQVRSLLAAQGIRSRLYAGFFRPRSRSGDPICQELIEDAEHNRLSGAIVAYGRPDREWARALKQRDLPVVGHTPEFQNYGMFDLTEQVRTATRRLLAAGRRKLAFMDWSGQRPTPASKDELFKAFAETLTEHGVPFQEQWVRCEFQPNLPGAGWSEFREIWTGSADKPDGLVVTDDVLFRGVARAIGEFGIRVPEQLRVVTHSNLGSLEECPFPLWRIVTDPDAVAQAQVDLLLALLRRRPIQQTKIKLPGQFIAPGTADGAGAPERTTINRASRVGVLINS